MLSVARTTAFRSRTSLAFLAMSLVLRAPELPALVGVATDLVRRPRAA